MKFFYKTLCGFLSLILFLGPQFSAWPQTLRQSNPLLNQTLDSQRVGSSSFGSRDPRSDLPIPGQGSPLSSQDLLLQESAAYGGLMYQIHILGEVQKPGTYRVTASTRLSEALQKAGGILERGSERRIEVRRREEGTRKVDLLSFKSLGNLDANPYLLDNDVIYVPLRDKVIEIEGTVQRPGTYELKGEKTLEDVVRLAGGFTSGVGNPTPIKVIRYNHGKKELISIENQEGPRREFQVANADVIVVPHFLTEKKNFDYNLEKLPGDNELFFPTYEDRIFVIGAIARPGPYPFNPYYDLKQYLTLAGGPTKLAKPKKIQLIRADGKKMKAGPNTEINPGDTLVVPEKYMAPETFVTLVVGIAASVVGITSAVVSLSR